MGPRRFCEFFFILQKINRGILRKMTNTVNEINKSNRYIN
ncbi:hypothetical protein HMPREF9413_3282 [Paenibacillus sp. HGF7]|nr:hypothetical protein HMPREF9413_3282 [Paenibacillus sp. HGF7]